MCLLRLYSQDQQIAGTKSKINLSTEHVNNKTSTERVKQKLVVEHVREKRNKSRKAQVTPASTDRVVGLIKGHGTEIWGADLVCPQDCQG